MKLKRFVEIKPEGKVFTAILRVLVLQGISKGKGYLIRYGKVFLIEKPESPKF